MLIRLYESSNLWLDEFPSLHHFLVRLSLICNAHEIQRAPNECSSSKKRIFFIVIVVVYSSELIELYLINSQIKFDLFSDIDNPFNQ